MWALIGVSVLLYVPFLGAFLVGLWRGLSVQSHMPLRCALLGIVATVLTVVFCSAVYAHRAYTKGLANAADLRWPCLAATCLFTILVFAQYMLLTAIASVQSERIDVTRTLSSENYGEAVREVDRLMQHWVLLLPGSSYRAELLVLKADALRYSKDFESADKIYDEVLARYPGAPAAKEASERRLALRNKDSQQGMSIP